MVRVLGRSRHE